MMRSFREYQPNERRNYITLSTGEYYPDILVDACKLYSPVLTIFSDILHHSGSSVSLFLSISEVSNQWMRTQLCRVFRKYVSPETPVEMLKKNTKARQICDEFGEGFRAIHTVQEMFDSRPFPDEALCAILWEYKDRGKKGYDLTEKFFDLMQTKFPDMCIWGPKRSGADDYTALKEAFYGEAIREKKPKKDGTSGGGNYYSTKLSYLGQRYTGEVFKQYFSGKIDSIRASEMLQSKVDHLPRLESAYFRGVG